LNILQNIFVIFGIDERNIVMIKNATVRPNTCKHRQNGVCTRVALCFESCPANVRYNEDNENNLPCDMAGYEPMKEEKVNF